MPFPDALRQSDLFLILGAVTPQVRKALRLDLASGRVVHGCFFDESGDRCLVGTLSQGFVRSRSSLQQWSRGLGLESDEALGALKRLIVGWDAGHEITKAPGYDSFYPEAEYAVSQWDVLEVLDALESAVPALCAA